MLCRQCNALLELRDLPTGAAEAGGLRVEIYGLRGARCEDPQHTPEPPYPDFPADLISAVAVGGALPTSVRRGLLRRRSCCARCGADLGGSAAEPGELRARMRLERAAPFTLSVEGPVVVCGECRLRQLSPGAGREPGLQEAILAALAATGLAVGGPRARPR